MERESQSRSALAMASDEEQVKEKTILPRYSFIDELIEEIDVNNLDYQMKQRILANMVFDRHGCQISRIIHKKSE